MALDPFRLQHPVDPKAVQTGLLDDNNREVPAGPRRSFAPELGEPTQQPRHLARRNRVLGPVYPRRRFITGENIQSKIIQRVGSTDIICAALIWFGADALFIGIDRATPLRSAADPRGYLRFQLCQDRAERVEPGRQR